MRIDLELTSNVALDLDMMSDSIWVPEKSSGSPE